MWLDVIFAALIVLFIAVLVLWKRSWISQGIEGLWRVLSHSEKVEASKQTPETHYEQLFHSAPSGLVIHDQLGQIFEMNRFARRLLGVGERQACDVLPSDILEEEEKNLFAQYLSRVASGQFQGKSKVMVRHLGGQTVLVQAASERIFRQEKALFLTSLVDISEYEKQVEARQEAEQRVHLLLDSTEEGLVGLDLNGCCVF